MKKLGKLLINPEKVIKSEELVLIKGGDSGYAWCVAWIEQDGQRGEVHLPVILEACTNDNEARASCEQAYVPEYQLALCYCAPLI